MIVSERPFSWGAALLCLLFGFAAYASEESAAPNPSDVPSDVPVSGAVVHKLKYPVANTHEVKLQYLSFYGDKFVNSSGVHFGDTFHFSESWGITAAAAWLFHGVSDEAKVLNSLGAAPRIIEPHYIFQLGAKFVPIHGKFMVRDFIQHFRIGLELGLQFNRLREYTTERYSVSLMNRLGPYGGINFSGNLTDVWSANLGGQLHLHSKVFEDKNVFGNLLNKSVRTNWSFLAGLGVRI